ncbi:vWA domain-containing protein [Fimbriiglobus ruber]|uniref:Secreted protein, containing von Willebrand factor (VWF) type A domain n=1 Tax=Fimbriiglobus ruber TaxID=1908690 RepID=A0A225DER8_9BACT|nr:vWA domain-containing protein [Fimbriiglobus ruber]OWK35826.1 Secreted protein, containing von Willebrand factor (VWF) type A domain [Fimbriiglobus ruber]
MRNRHKPPTLVSMWMLDVFCCALGCVTLLWLLNTREAGEQATRAGSALELLNKTESELKKTRSDLIATKADLDQTRRKLNADIEELNAKLLAMTDVRDETAKKLALAQGDVAAAEAKLAAAATRTRELDDMLARKQKDAKDLAAKLATTAQSADDLSKLLREREQDRDTLALKAKKAEDQLNDADAKIRALTKENQDATSSLSAMKKTGDELSASQTALRDLRKKVDEANVTIIDLQSQNTRLNTQIGKLKTESDSRFAGIAMTGRRVVFLVDISGSMKLIDDKTPAPEKWPTVVETVSRVMRSLPELEKFQVIIFSRKADYLLSTGDWLSYEGESSVKQVADALRKVEPVGDTNMYAAFDLAFRLRATGLDTIYLFSDGLPTSGAGLTPAEEKTLADAARSEKLSGYIRKTLANDWNRRTPGSGRVKINSVGFFFESPEVGAFLWALSRDNDGSFVGMSRP